MSAPRLVIAAGGTIETALLPGRILFMRADYDVNVRVALSRGGQEFVTLTAMRGVSDGDVYHANAQFEPTGSPMHLSLAEADALVLYPATARVLAECAAGSVTDTVTRLFAFTPKDRIAVAPAIHPQMDPRPYRAHLRAIQALGCSILGGDDLHADWATVKSWAVARLGLQKTNAGADVVRLDALAAERKIR